MLGLHRTTFVACAAALAALLFLYAFLGTPKPATEWQWVDIAGEGGTALMSGVWLVFVLGGRPRGRVTTLLAWALASIMLAAWADCLDEFYRVADIARWDNAFESVLMPAGVLLLTVGLFYWREEQQALSRQLGKRERLFREHRSFDAITQLADVGYLVRQLRMERERDPNAPLALILVDIDDFHAINREHGQREGDRVLQAVSHLLLLNLRNRDLLCRYAADRFAVMLPDTTAASAERTSVQLRRAVQSLRHHSAVADVPLALSARCVSNTIDGDVEAALRELNAAIDPATRGAPQPA